MLPSKEDGVILVLHQGQRNSALLFWQEFIKHWGDSERQILVLLNDPWVARRNEDAGIIRDLLSVLFECLQSIFDHCDGLIFPPSNTGALSEARL